MGIHWSTHLRKYKKLIIPEKMCVCVSRILQFFPFKCHWFYFIINLSKLNLVLVTTHDFPKIKNSFNFDNHSDSKFEFSTLCILQFFGKNSAKHSKYVPNLFWKWLAAKNGYSSKTVGRFNILNFTKYTANVWHTSLFINFWISN